MAYFDNAATTFPKPEIVYSEMDRFCRANGASAGRGSYEKLPRRDRWFQIPANELNLC